jgi:small-conductance mechanosensitive channel
VYFQGDWGFVEDITYTFITIRTWDQRRVVVPLDYLISHPIENWSRTDKHLIKPVHLYADYNVDVEAIRQKFKELLREDEDWDERSEPVLHVTNLTEETVELRALCSAADPMRAWYLHTRMREQLLNFLRELEDGRYLPRRRLVFTDNAEPAPASRPPEHELQPFADGRRDGENRENGEEH